MAGNKTRIKQQSVSFPKEYYCKQQLYTQMNDQNPVIHNPKAKAAKPQGQLASLMQSRWGDDFGPAAGEINRSSSAPPTQLLMQNNVRIFLLALIPTCFRIWK